jgi:ribosome-associated protein
VQINPWLSIPDSEVEFSFTRSSGPGGQNVNKVSSKAVLRWNLLASAGPNPEQLALLKVRLANRLTQSGDLVLMSDRFRDQIKNRQDCLTKFQELLVAALFVAKKRKKTKPSRSSVQRVKESKSRNSEKKKMRKVKY